MGLRFRRSLRIAPGLRINLGKRGASLSVGVRGAHVTIGRSGVRETVGIPGSGLTYTQLTPTARPAPPSTQRHTSRLSILVLIGLLAFLVHLIRHS